MASEQIPTAIVLTEPYKKGTDARILAIYPSEQAALEHIQEVNWASKRGTPHLIEASKAEQYALSRKTGIFAPAYVPPSAAEQTAKYEREKAKQNFEEITTKARKGDPVALQLAASKYGLRITPEPQEKTKEIFVPVETAKQEVQNLLFAKQEQAAREAVGIKQRLGLPMFEDQLREETLELTASGKVVRFTSRPVGPGERSNAVMNAAPVDLRINTFFNPGRQIELEQEGLLGKGKSFISGFGDAFLTVTEPIREPIKFSQKAQIGALTFVSLYPSELYNVAKQKGTEFALGFGQSLRQRPGGVLGELAFFELLGRGSTKGGQAARKAKFNYEIRAFENQIVDKQFKFGQEVFEPVSAQSNPTKRPTMNFDPANNKVTFTRAEIIDTAPASGSFPVFDNSGAIVGRQTQLRAASRPEAEAQAEFISPRIGTERQPFKQQDDLLKFAERPLSPIQKEFILNPFYIEQRSPKQTSLGDFPSIRRTMPPQKPNYIIEYGTGPSFRDFLRNKKGSFNIGQFPENPFGSFDTVGDYFTRKPRASRSVDPGFYEPAAIDTGFDFNFLSGLSVFQGQAAKSSASLRFSPDLDVGFKPAQDFRTGQELDIFPAVDTALNQSQRSAQRQDQLFSLDIFQQNKTVSENAFAFDLDFDFGRGRSPREPTKPPRDRFPRMFDIFDEPNRKGSSGTEGFDVFIREKGEMIKANVDPLPKNRALNFGADIVDNSSAASFSVRKSKKRSQDFYDDPGFFNAGKFTEPKRGKRKNRYVEKDLFRIDSPGELAGITAKGLIAQRRQRAFGGWF